MIRSSGIAGGFDPPYYAVIFTSRRTERDEGYAEMADHMLALASEQPGFLGFESVREGSVGITTSYWTSEEAIARWKRNLEHREAQATGRDAWYSEYRVRVARVEREYAFNATPGSPSGAEEVNESDEASAASNAITVVR